MGTHEKLDRNSICEKLKEYAANRKKLLIFCHQNPDGDTVGSSFALKLIYEALGGTAKCVCSTDAPQYLRFLYSGQERLSYRSGNELSYNVLCAVDVATPSQLGALGILAGKFSFMIDHHDTGEAFAPCWNDPSAAACGELIYKIYRKLYFEGAIRRDPEIARRLYAAVSSDTGSFKYSNTTPETHLFASELVGEICKANDGGITPWEISRKLHDCNSQSDLQAKKIVIEKLRLAAGGKLSYTVITAEDMEKAKLNESDFGSAIDIPRSVEGTLVGFTIKQSKKDTRSFRISSRSNCDIDVAKVCAQFGGGGHTKAAGATISATNAEEAENTVVRAFAKAVEEYCKKQDQK